MKKDFDNATMVLIKTSFNKYSLLLFGEGGDYYCYYYVDVIVVII